MNAPATAAAVAAPNAVPPAEGKKQPAWLTMTEADFEAYVVSAKIGSKSKRADEMRARRKEYAEADDEPAAAPEVGTLPPLFDPSTSNQAQAAQPLRRRPTKRDVVAAAIALDKAPPDALRTRFIDPKMIDIQEGWNARFDFGDIQELANSIKHQKALDGHGLINDIRVKEKADGRYALVDGERRLHSVLHLIEQGEVFEFGIPAKVERADAEDAELLIKMFTANQGKNFLPIEEANYYKRLRDSGLTIAQIEEKTGRSDNTIVACLALLDADEDLVDAVSSGKISGSLGKSIAVNVRGNKDKQRELVAAAKAAKNNPKAMKDVKKKIDEERKTKYAARTGKQAKGRFDQLSAQELSELGTNVGMLLKEQMEANGMDLKTDMKAWIDGSQGTLRIAALYGALEALKGAAGVKVDLTFGGDGKKAK